MPLPILAGSAPAPACWFQISASFGRVTAAYLEENYANAAEAFLAATQPPVEDNIDYADVIYVARRQAYENAWVSFKAAKKRHEGRKRILRLLSAEEPEIVEDLQRILADAYEGDAPEGEGEFDDGDSTEE